MSVEPPRSLRDVVTLLREHHHVVTVALLGVLGETGSGREASFARLKRCSPSTRPSSRSSSTSARRCMLLSAPDGGSLVKDETTYAEMFDRAKEQIETAVALDAP